MVGLLLMASPLSLPGVPPQPVLLAGPVPASRTPVPALAILFFGGRERAREVHCLLLLVLPYICLLFPGMNGLRKLKVQIPSSYFIGCCYNPKSMVEFTINKYNLFDFKFLRSNLMLKNSFHTAGCQ
jgi:hypothetical protein